MPKPDRLALIAEIEKQRDTHLITYVTSTRQGLEVPMAMDSVPKIYEHLRLAKTPKSKTHIDLFLHSNGGDGTVPWRLVTLLREFADKLTVVVPHRAFSAATLTALGADEILMHPMGMLGPTDPTVANAFNPVDPTNPGQRIGISVEDVTAYLALITEDAGIRHEEEVVLAFNKLAEQIHPLALGNVKRSLSQSRMMARKLLGCHMDASHDEQRIGRIVDNFTSKLFYHGHPINRVEAREELHLATVKDPPKVVEDLIWRLYENYETEIRLEEPFQIADEFLASHPTLQPGVFAITDPKTTPLVFIESGKRADVFELTYQITGQMMPDHSTNVRLLVQKRGWRTI